MAHIYPLAKAAPDKTIVTASPEALCAFMKQNTLRKVYRSLRDGVHEITVEPELAARRASRSTGCLPSCSFLSAIRRDALTYHT